MAIKGVIQIDNLAKAISENLRKYSGEVGEAVEEVAMKTAKLGVKLLKSSSPQLTGSYTTGWRIKKLKNGQWIIHNATDYQLTHLLEKGHAKVGGGRVAPKVHIAPVEEFLIGTFEEDLKKVLRQ